MSDERNWRVLVTEEDVTPEIEAFVEETVDWFDDERTMPTEEFIDRLCKTYGGDGRGEADFDLDQYDNPAARKIMRIARRIRKERTT